ncbi:MAG TPA: tetratricopeptide repeat protein [Candidatus Omnitrophota bacterium]|nr:tetratricopeptide repeat protein [Candidatus Omnitrophota bacterium]
MASWCKKAGGGLAALAVTAVLVAGCQPRAGNDDAARKAAAEHRGQTTALTAFLAGRFAHQQGDTRAAAEYYAQALKHDPDNVELLGRAFTLMVAEGRFDDAVPLAHRLLAFDADSPIPLLVAGVADARDGRFAQAEARFAALPKRGFNVFLSPLLAAWCRAGEGKTDAAMDLLKPLAEAKGLEPLHAFHAGLINDIGGRTEAAEGHYVAALDSALAIRTIEAAGSFYQRTGRIEKARSLYQGYESEHPDTMLFDGAALLKAGAGVPRAVPDAKAGIAQALFDAASMMRQGNALDVSLLFSRLTLALDPNFTLARMTVGDILSQQERLAEANSVYSGIDRSSAAHDYARLRVAMNLEDMGDVEGALAALDALAKDRPQSIDALTTKGDVLRKHKRFEEAAAAYQAAFTRLGPPQERHWLLHFSRGIAYERSGQWPKAEADFARALELKPDQPDVLNYLGYSWVDRGERLEEGRKMIEKAVELRPKDGAIVDSLGWALYRMGDFQGAVKQLERAIELKPEDPTINDHLGDAYWQVGRTAEAMFQWQRAMTLDPEPEQIAPLKEKIRTGEVPAQPVK